MVQQRNIAVAIILSIVTCGIYGIYWYIMLNDEVNSLNGTQNDTSGGMVFLFSLITCGIYMHYWMYKMGEKLDNTASAKGQVPQSRGVIYLILSIFGLGIISLALMQDAVNKML